MIAIIHFFKKFIQSFRFFHYVHRHHPGQRHRSVHRYQYDEITLKYDYALKYEFSHLIVK